MNWRHRRTLNARRNAERRMQRRIAAIHRRNRRNLRRAGRRRRFRFL